MKQPAIVIDHEKCWGCKTCEVACKQELAVAEGVKLISVEEDGPRTVSGKPFFQYRVKLCRHCDDPPCVDVCPEAAIRKRADGIVVLDEKMCSGCQACLEACPYDAIDFDAAVGIALKCNLCHHRVDHGLIPACADNVCLAHCIHFGDAAEVSRE
jgi:Fe-S-cluster-containing dehydrogenase component